MKPVKFRFVFFLMVSILWGCETNENNHNPFDDTRIYDQRYFSAKINNQEIRIDDSLSQISPSRIYTNIRYEDKYDSVMLNYGICINDEINKSSINVIFIIKEAVNNLDTLGIYYYEYDNISDLNKIVSDNSWNYELDSIYYTFGSLFEKNGKSNTGIYITYNSDNVNYYSATCERNSKSDFKIINNYIKPVIINHHQDGSNEMDIDSVLYIEGEFNCDLISPETYDTVKIRNAKFKGDVYTKYFYN